MTADVVELTRQVAALTKRVEVLEAGAMADIVRAECRGDFGGLASSRTCERGTRSCVVDHKDTTGDAR